MRALVLAGLVLSLGTGCDRAPVDPLGTGLLIADPDLDVVRTDPDLVVRLAPNGPSGPLTLAIRNKEIPFDSTAGVFVYERRLERGLNTFPYTVTDEAGTVLADTFYVVFLDAQFQPLVGTDQGVARAGAAATTLGSGAAAVTGGVGRAGEVLASASLIRPAGASVVAEEVALRVARAFHTSTAVGGGALLVGGARAPGPSAPADFVGQVEWVGPDGATAIVPTGDATVLRAGHGAQLVAADGGPFLYLLGGQVPGALAAATVDVFRVDLSGPVPRLEAVSPAGGASGFVALGGLAYAPTGPQSGVGFGLDGDEGVTARTAWALPGTGPFPFSLGTAAGAALATPRTGAATADLGGGLTLVIGGRDADGRPLASFELYAAAADRVFRFPDGFALDVARSDAVATIFDPARILVGGGRPGSGSAIVAYEAFSF